MTEYDYELMEKVAKKISKKLDKHSSIFCLVVLADLLCKEAIDEDFTEREFIRCMRQIYRLYSDGSEL
jgi:hypothetical protein